MIQKTTCGSSNNLYEGSSVITAEADARVERSSL